MIKSELLQRVAEQNRHLYHLDAEKIVDAILGEIIAALTRGDRVELRGFGTFRSSVVQLASAATRALE